MTSVGDLEARVEAGEALRFHTSIRRGGRVGVTDDRVIIVRDDGTESVRLEAIAEVTVQTFDWFLAILSVVLIGFGLLSLRRSVLGGLAFTAFGVGSFYWTYRKRGKVQLHLHQSRKAVTFSIAASEEFQDALGRALDRFREKHDLESTAEAER